MDNNIPAVDAIYEDRTNFCVIALTGYTGSGCSTLASCMSDKEFYKNYPIRNINILGIKYARHNNNSAIYFENESGDVNASISQLNFKQKFKLCKDYIASNYEPYTVIRYSWVLLFMALQQACLKSNDAEEFKNKIKEIIQDKFKPSIDQRDDEYRKETNNHIWENPFNDFLDDDWDNLYQEFEKIKNKTGIEKQVESAKLFGLIGDKENRDTIFIKFKDKLNDWMFKGDYYCGSFFYHRLGYQLRKSGDALNLYDDVYDKEDDFNYIYCVVKTIKDLIKGIRHRDTDKVSDCRVVIDSIRNSLEARYLKERYSAFYLIAVHAPDDAKTFFRNKILTYLNKDYREETEISRNLGVMIDKAWQLGKEEQSNEDFERGRFAAPNIEKCVADAEIHIVNSKVTHPEAPFFQSMGEQWMKYAALILHPGLVTPSSEERCMVVAYTAKFNSGCLSRQVGAVITNYAHSIRSIGWNDVPYGQLSCSLRSLYDFPTITDKSFDNVDNDAEKREIEGIYSAFERGKHIPGKYKGEIFGKKVMLKYERLRNPEEFRKRLKGLPLSYCFKSFHNEFEGVKNQVHTRALHAEENAILQVARFGGMGLENGIIYVTASPCELCCKKLYQIGIRKIVYIDEYPGISRENIISIGFKRPDLKQFQGAFGATYFKLYQPLMPYKEELDLRLHNMVKKTKDEPKDEYTIFNEFLKSKKLPIEPEKFTHEQREELLKFFRSILKR